MDETSQCKDEVFQYAFKNNNLEYKSSLRGFSSKLFSLFKSHYDDLKVSQSIQSLFKGDIVNETENQSALHHVYRDFVAGRNLVPKPPTGKIAFFIFIQKLLILI